MNDSENFMLITEFKVVPEQENAVIKIWKSIYQNDDKRCLYKNMENNNFLEIILLNKATDMHIKLNNNVRDDFVSQIKPLLLSDWRMQLLELKDEVITNGKLLPTTKYLQLRYIEVPLKVYDEYFQWRRSTIFDHVKKYSEIESFSAYHSIISTQPGVIFLSGFSGDVDKYLTIFSCDEFQRISNEAKRKYILGGDQGLFTILYEKI